MSWENVLNKINKEVRVGTNVPKMDTGSRPVTRIVGNRIYIRTGVKTNAQKYTTKEMLKYAYDTIESGETFTRGNLKSRFPKEFSQGGCVFSMTGGILVLAGVAKNIPRVGYVSI